jgi:hypothetical protein
MSWQVEAYICIETSCKQTDGLVRVSDQYGQPYGPFCRAHAAAFIKQSDATASKLTAEQRAARAESARLHAEHRKQTKKKRAKK